MGKRDGGKFEKRPRDLYPTVDPSAVTPLIPFVKGLRYAEPCAGAGDLVDLLLCDALCGWESDVDPQKKSIRQQDALTITKEDLWDCDVIITNPPFSFNLLQPLLDHLPTLKPTWLLLPADVAYNKRMGPYMERCSDIVAVGRLYWMDNRVKGVDNFAWFRFTDEVGETVFYGR